MTENNDDHMFKLISSSQCFHKEIIKRKHLEMIYNFLIHVKTLMVYYLGIGWAQLLNFA